MKLWARERDLLVEQTLAFVEGVTGNAASLRAAFSGKSASGKSTSGKSVSDKSVISDTKPIALDSASETSSSADAGSQLPQMLRVAPIDDTSNEEPAASTPKPQDDLWPSLPTPVLANGTLAALPTDALRSEPGAEENATSRPTFRFTLPSSAATGAVSSTAARTTTVPPAAVSAREEIQRRVSAFRVRQERFQRERAKAYDEILARVRNGLAQ